MKITEHLLFAALMIPTFLLLAAAAVSLAQPEPQADLTPVAVVAANFTGELNPF